MLEGNTNFSENIADIIEIANISNMENTKFFTQYQTINHLLKSYSYYIIEQQNISKERQDLIDNKLFRNTQTLEFYQKFSERENNKDLARDIASSLKNIQNINKRIKAFESLYKDTLKLKQELYMKQKELNDMLKKNNLFNSYKDLGGDFISIINLFNT